MALEELLEAELLKADLVKRVSPIENNDKCWEKAAKEVLHEKEKELDGNGLIEGSIFGARFGIFAVNESAVSMYRIV